VSGKSSLAFLVNLPCGTDDTDDIAEDLWDSDETAEDGPCDADEIAEDEPWGADEAAEDGPS